MQWLEMAFQEEKLPLISPRIYKSAKIQIQYYLSGPNWSLLATVPYVISALPIILSSKPTINVFVGEDIKT